MEWIKCSDRMPDERCIMYTPGQTVEFTWRIVPAGIAKVISDATHWMPLPELPQDAKENL